MYSHPGHRLHILKQEMYVNVLRINGIIGPCTNL